MSSMIIKSREANDLKLTAYHGHFATRHSHNSHYLDITRMKHECAMANIAAASLANHYVYEKEIDTVVCLDGSEVIGTFLARQLSQKNLFSLSSEKNICVVAPEHDSNGLLIFRDNLRPMVSEKNVLLLISTVNSGKTAARALECIEYYGGTTQGVAAVFSALKQVGDIPVISLFSPVSQSADFLFSKFCQFLGDSCVIDAGILRSRPTGIEQVAYHYNNSVAYFHGL